MNPKMQTHHYGLVSEIMGNFNNIFKYLGLICFIYLSAFHMRVFKMVRFITLDLFILKYMHLKLYFFKHNFQRILKVFSAIF